MNPYPSIAVLHIGEYNMYSTYNTIYLTAICLNPSHLS